MKYLCPRDFRRGEMEEKMKDYQNLLGKIFIAVAIIIAAFIIANAIDNAGANILQGLSYVGELLR